MKSSGVCGDVSRTKVCRVVPGSIDTIGSGVTMDTSGWSVAVLLSVITVRYRVTYSGAKPASERSIHTKSHEYSHAFLTRVGSVLPEGTPDNGALSGDNR